MVRYSACDPRNKAALQVHAPLPRPACVVQLGARLGLARIKPAVLRQMWPDARATQRSISGQPQLPPADLGDPAATVPRANGAELAGLATARPAA